MILTAHQVGYLPGLRLLHKIAKSDLFCSFDIVPMDGSGFDNRNKIKTQHGEQWLTVPVHGGRDVALSDVQIAPGNWNRKHLRAIELAYRKAPYFENYFHVLEHFISDPGTEWLTTFNRGILEWMMSHFDIQTEIVEASDRDFTGTKSELVLDMCRDLGATHYIFGSQGRNYADVAAFNAAGITVEFQDYQYPTYNQLHGPFIPNMSALDLLFNHGPESRKILMGE
jgi:hypothetical protein